MCFRGVKWSHLSIYSYSQPSIIVISVITSKRDDVQVLLSSTTSPFGLKVLHASATFLRRGSAGARLARLLGCNGSVIIVTFMLTILRFGSRTRLWWGTTRARLGLLRGTVRADIVNDLPAAHCLLLGNPYRWMLATIPLSIINGSAPYLPDFTASPLCPC
jgi:hypothetical protein